MMTSKLFSAALLTCLFSICFLATSAQTDSPPVDAEVAIAEANTNINTLLKAGKYDEASKYFMEDVIQIISGQPTINSRAAWVATQKGAAEFGEWDLVLETLDLEVCDNIAVERGRGTQTFVANEKSPMPSFSATGDYVVMWKLINGNWRIQWDYVIIAPEGPAGK